MNNRKKTDKQVMHYLTQKKEKLSIRINAVREQKSWLEEIMSCLVVKLQFR